MSIAAAPWVVRCSGAVWLGSRRPAASVPTWATLGGAVRYRTSPVGPYAEVFALEWLRQWPPAGHVPFMAVDSPASQQAGRANWALPKEAATFTGDSAGGLAAGSSSSERPWRLQVRWRARGPRLPVLLRGALRQSEGDDVLRTPVRARGWVRPAVVTIDVDGDPPGLAPGRRPGAWVDLRLHLGIPAHEQAPGPSQSS